MDLNKLFKAKNIAIVGVSKNPKKPGHVIFRNLVESNFQGKVFLVNPNAYQLLNKYVYKSLLSIKEQIDLAIITVPARLVPNIIKDCRKKKIEDVIIISSGFKEIGNNKLENEINLLLNKFNIKCIGANSLGIFDAYAKFDSLLLPRINFKRPKKGSISFLSQSGSVGAAFLDLLTKEDYGISKFISYGNATNLDESDILEFLLEDKDTRVICLYLEDVKDGQKFLKIAKKVSKNKPIIAMKALADETYFAAFKQANIINANSLREMLDFARILEKAVISKGNRIQVITNGFGYGLIAKNEILKSDLKLAILDDKKNLLKKQLSSLNVIGNPLNLSNICNTEDYRLSIKFCLNDNNSDILLLIIVYQSPLLDENILDVIIEENNLKKKPIIIVSTGGEFSDSLKRSLEEKNIVSFTFPDEAVRAIKTLIDYYSRK
jgi:acyl-CoA synthetase (NDP forming)